MVRIQAREPWRHRLEAGRRILIPVTGVRFPLALPCHVAPLGLCGMSREALCEVGQIKNGSENKVLFCYNKDMYYAYLLRLQDGDYYAGSTQDLEERVRRHEQGRNIATKDKRPLRLVWFAGFETKKLAQSFEKYLKSSSGFAFRNKRLI